MRTAVPLPRGVLGRSPEYLPHGRTQTRDRRLKTHESRDNLWVAGVAAFNQNQDTGAAAWLGLASYAGEFAGDVLVYGKVSNAGAGLRIDHPLDPANKELLHSVVESSDRKTIYDGMAILNADGEAVVQLPVWFQALNTKFCYQLTPIGAAGSNLHIAEELSNNCFKIAGGAPSMKVCWQVTGVRQDAWAKAHPVEVEADKDVQERGYYHYPELCGATKKQSIERVRHPEKPRLIDDDVPGRSSGAVP